MLFRSLFTLSRIERLIGNAEFQKKLDGHQKDIMRYFIREMLHKKRRGLEEYVNKDASPQARIVKITMILKSLTFNWKTLEDNFDPYIKDTIIETV